MHYSVGFDFDERVRVAIGQLAATARKPALDPHTTARHDAQVGSGPGWRAIPRRGPPRRLASLTCASGAP